MSTPNHKIRLIMELRGTGVTDPRVLGAIERIPREEFTPPSLRDRAYENTALPIARGQTLSQPTVVGLMTQALELGPRMKVLEIGTGSGYQAAILSLLCRRVYTVERHRPLMEAANELFQRLRLHNITSRLGDGWQGWPEQAPFDRIIVTAAPEEVPQALLEQLAPGGIMVLPLGDDRRAQHLVRIRKAEDGTLSEEDLGPVRFVPMVHGLPSSPHETD